MYSLVDCESAQRNASESLSIAAADQQEAAEIHTEQERETAAAESNRERCEGAMQELNTARHRHSELTVELDRAFRRTFAHQKRFEELNKAQATAERGVAEAETAIAAVNAALSTVLNALAERGRRTAHADKTGATDVLGEGWIGAARTVLGVLNAHPRVYVVQRAGMRALVDLCRDVRTAQFVNEQNGGQLALSNAFRDPLKDECVALRSLLANSRLDAMARTLRYIALATGDKEPVSADTAGVVGASAGTASQSRQSLAVVDDIDGLCSQITYVALLTIAVARLLLCTHCRCLHVFAVIFCPLYRPIISPFAVRMLSFMRNPCRQLVVRQSYACWSGRRLHSGTPSRKSASGQQRPSNHLQRVVKLCAIAPHSRLLPRRLAHCLQMLQCAWHSPVPRHCLQRHQL